MLRGQNIVCFAKDWSQDPTSNNHVMRLLAEDNKVLWVNSVGTRTPNLRDSGDLRKMRSKFLEFTRALAQGATQVAEGLWIFTPILLPFPHNSVARRLNRLVLRHMIALQMRRIGMSERFQLWTFLPTAAPYVDAFGEELLVYYITDEFSQFSELPTERILRMERELCRKADIVFVTAKSLLVSKAPFNEATYLASHGVDREHFARALEEGAVVHPDLEGISGPVLGFFGLIHDWIDLDLLDQVARERPDWSIVLVGKSKVDISRLEILPNIHLLGRKPYEELPALCKGFDVALVPFVVNELTVHVNPIKLREYLSAGLPVVSTPLPECAEYSDWCHIADGVDDFIAACEEAMAQDSLEQRIRRSEAMCDETWRAKVEQIGDHVVRIRDKERTA